MLGGPSFLDGGAGIGVSLDLLPGVGIATGLIRCGEVAVDAGDANAHLRTPVARFPPLVLLQAQAVHAGLDLEVDTEWMRTGPDGASVPQGIGPTVEVFEAVDFRL